MKLSGRKTEKWERLYGKKKVGRQQQVLKNGKGGKEEKRGRKKEREDKRPWVEFCCETSMFKVATIL